MIGEWALWRSMWICWWSWCSWNMQEINIYIYGFWGDFGTEMCIIPKWLLTNFKHNKRWKFLACFHRSMPKNHSQVSVGNDHHGWFWTHRHTRLEQGKNYIDLHFLDTIFYQQTLACPINPPCSGREGSVFTNECRQDHTCETTITFQFPHVRQMGTVYSPSVKNKSPQDEKKGRSCQMFFFKDSFILSLPFKIADLFTDIQNIIF